MNFPGEQHRIAVEGDEGVFQTCKGLEIRGFGDADGSTVKILTPDGVVGVLDLHQTGVVGVLGHEGLALAVDEGNLVPVKVPMDAVGAPAKVDIGDTVQLLAPEHADEAVLIGNNRTVENPGDTGQGIPADNRIFRVPPQGAFAAGGLILPGDVG